MRFRVDQSRAQIGRLGDLGERSRNHADDIVDIESVGPGIVSLAPRSVVIAEKDMHEFLCLLSHPGAPSLSALFAVYLALRHISMKGLGGWRAASPPFMKLICSYPWTTYAAEGFQS
jgi:hypothetical protein